MATKRELIKALSNFTIEELLLKILSDIGIPDGNKLKKAIVNKRLSLTKKNIVNWIADKLQRLKNEEQMEILQNLHILNVILHSNRRKWISIQLLGGEDSCMSSLELQNNIKRQLLRDGTRGEVIVKLATEMQWIRIVEKKLMRGRGIVLQAPVLAVIAPGYHYMFVNSSPKEHILLCIAKALGRERFKKCKLEGKHIKSLLSLLKAKEANAYNTRNVLTEPQYQPETPRSSAEGVDFMQSNSRRTHCTEIFTNDDDEMPQLEEMVVKVEGVGWRLAHLVPEMEGKPFSMEIKFRSTSIAQMFTEMAELGAMSTPLPEYARRLPTLGRNIVGLKSQ